ncbi:hypothetical protein N8371_02445 [Vicingaceae bacterium]|nr:hypothetical protein [Vicingaceae bacterium]MDB4061474.1 hypothetical protein [Vicingaceae bacterium]MDC1451264.1 hypothetical protein [Vicingaceae bacterium]
MKSIKVLLAAISFFSTSVLFAQLAHPHFISLNAGSNIPFSEYGEIDSLSNAGANPGIYYSFEAGAYFSKLLGIGLNIGAFNNSIDDQGIIDQLKSDFRFRNSTFDVTSKSWTNGYIMVGPYFSFGSQRFIVDLKVLGGIINSERPFINIQSNDDQYEFNSAAVNGTSFGVNYGMHFRIQLKGKFALRINGEGMLTKQEFEEKITETLASGTLQAEKRQTVTREISVLNLGVGLIINL